MSEGKPPAAIGLRDPCDLRHAPATQKPYFDGELNAWVLTRYEDVAAAFRSAELMPVNVTSTIEGTIADDTPRLKARAETIAALSSAALQKWNDEITGIGHELLHEMEASRHVDLIGQYARPLCEKIAVVVTCPSTSRQDLLLELASEISRAAAEPYDSKLAERAEVAGAELKKYFSSGPRSLRGSGFVALSQTLARLLARCWLALLQNPAEWTLLHDRPELMGNAVDELLRYAGLTEILFRMAAADLDLNSVRIRKGERVMLRISAANKDPDKFRDAKLLHIAAKRGGQLTLGLSKHACVGAPLIRMILATTTQLLIEHFPSAKIAGEIEWSGGSGFCFPAAIPVLLY
jgi:hypothetical protein